MRRLAVQVILIVSTATALAAQQIDMAAVQRWSNVKTVRYHVAGSFQGWTPVSSQQSAEGNVTDAATLDFDWNVRQRMMIGEPKFQNAKSAVTALRDRGECTTPVLKGEYEHLEITDVKADDMGRVVLTGTRVYPAALAASECPASKALIPAAPKQQTVTEYLAVPDPRIMATAGMGPGTPNVTFTPDKKSFILKIGGWSWTVTPTPLP